MGSEGWQERVFERLFRATEIAKFNKTELYEYEITGLPIEEISKL